MNLVKIFFELNPEDWHRLSSESLWAEPLGSNGSDEAYRLRNSPFYVRGVSFLDIVRAAPGEEGKIGLLFAGVVEHLGNSTFRMVVPFHSSEFEFYWARLAEFGCTYESKFINTSYGNRILYAMDVPRRAALSEVIDILAEGEKNNIWMFDEGYVHNDALGVVS